MNIVADLEMLQKAYSTLKPREGYGVVEANKDYLEQVYEQHPLRIEGYGVLYWRAQGVKKFLREQLKHAPLEGQKKVAVVAHSSFLKCITAEGLDDKGDLIGGANMKNCEIFPLAI